MCIYPDAILVTLSLSEPFVSLQTYGEKHGKSQRFYLSKQSLLNAESSITEMDLLNVCTVSHVDNSIRFQMLWLHGNYNDDICGYRQSFAVPADKVARVLSGETVRFLSYMPIHPEKAAIFFTKTAHRAIAKADKLKRRAICKFLRDNFNYSRSEHLVVQEDSWVHGFYFFSTVSNYEGGIVLHDTVVRGKDGKPYRKVYFGLHT